MVISVIIAEGTEKILVEQAALRGQTVESYAAELISKGIKSDRSFAEILAPFREQIVASGISDADLDELFEAARLEVHEEKQGQR